MHQAREIRNVALIGFMGAGKTSVGHLLATALGFRLVDTDQLIEEQTAKRIAEIFATEGEAQFRAYERQVLEGLARQSRLVISTGGGLAANHENFASLKSHALVVCLWASPETIWHRVGHQSHRPLLHGPDPLNKIRRLLAEREPFYRQADVLVNTEARSVKEVAHQVLHQFHVAQTVHRAA
ncbi:MAG: shikimate kinase [Verrucomicrobiales bacterium]|nr:shikimate kinase [Verrucomicrobiales bacterium]